MDTAASGLASRRRSLKPATSWIAALLCAALPLAAQESKLEAEAKRAFDAGRFKEAGEKYAKAAEAPGLAAERKSDLSFQAAWAYFIAGNSRAARDNLKVAFTARPNLDVVADFYSPDFVRLAQTVRAEVAGPASLPAADVAELKRSAREKLADGKAEEALYDLKKIESSPDPPVHRLLADTYDRLGRTAEADSERRKASELERALVTTAPIGAAAPPAFPIPNSAPAAASVSPLLEVAENALKAGDFRGAQTVAARAIEADPKSAEAHRLSADSAFALGQDAEAEREYTAAIVLDSGNWRAEFGLGRVAEREKKWNTAASHYRRVLEVNGKSVAAALGLGRSMEEVDKTAARIAYGRAVEIDPGSPEARNDFGVFLLRAEDPERAIAELIESVRLAPQRALFHENLARAYRRQQKWKEAERELTEATRMAPNETAAWATLGQLRLRQRKLAEAATAYRAAFDLDPASEEAASGLAETLSEAGRLEDAETVLVKALESSPNSAVLWNNLGVVRTRRGAFATAREAFGKSLVLDPAFEPAKTNLARAEQLSALERAAS